MAAISLNENGKPQLRYSGSQPSLNQNMTNALKKEQWLHPKILGFPYVSNRSDGPEMAINHRFLLKNTTGHSDVTAVCRHLAILWKEIFEANGGKINYEHLSSEKIAENDKSTLDEQVYKCLFHSRSVFCHHDQWGEQIVNEFKKMEGNKETHTSIIIWTSNHIMTLGFKIKERDDGIKEYVGLFYDSNERIHKRVVTRDLGSFMSIKATDFIDNNQSEYYGTGQFTVFSGTPQETSNIVAQWNVLQSLNKLTADALHFFLLYPFNRGYVQKHCVNLLAPLDAKQQAEILVAKDGWGKSFLIIALEHNRPTPLTEYFTLFRQLNLQPCEILAILKEAIKRDDGISALYQGYKKSNIAAVNSFIEGLQPLGLSKEQLIEFFPVNEGEYHEFRANVIEGELWRSLSLLISPNQII